MAPFEHGALVAGLGGDYVVYIMISGGSRPRRLPAGSVCLVVSDPVDDYTLDVVTSSGLRGRIPQAFVRVVA